MSNPEKELNLQEENKPKESPNKESFGPEEEIQDSLKKIEDLINLSEGKKKVITDETLNRIAISAIKPWSQTTESLNDLLKTGNDLYLGKKISSEEWEILAPLIHERKIEIEKNKTGENEIKDSLGKIAGFEERSARAAEETARRTAGEQVDILPRDEKEQRKLILGLIEQIETNDLPIAPVPNVYLPPNNSMLAGRLSSLLEMEGISKEVKKEAMARLKIQHCAAIADAIPGSSREAVPYLYSVFLQPESRRYAIEGEDLDYLFNHIPGLKVADAFIKLQSAWKGGLEIDGENVSLAQRGLSLAQIEKIYEKIEEGLGLNKKEAEKSLKLAIKIAKATLETSVWNESCAGNDPLSEAIWFEGYRTRRAEKGRDRGPEITIDRIKCCGTSFLRTAQLSERIKINEKESDDKYLFLPHPEYSFKSLSNDPNHRERLKRYLKRMREEPLNVKDMDFSLIAPGSYQGWMTMDLNRTLIFQSLLLQTNWKPQDINSDIVEGWVAPSNAADPEQVMRLRCELCLGIFWSIFSRRAEAMNNGWDNFSLSAVIKNLTRKFISIEKNKEISFLTENQLSWVKNTLREYGLRLEHEAAIVGTGITFTKRVIGK